MKNFPIAVVLVSGFLFGCAAGEPEIKVPKEAPTPAAVSPPAPAPVTPRATTRVDTYREREPNMTGVLKEKGIPDRVANEGGKTIWFYETGPGEEIFTFGKKGEFISHEIREKVPGY